MDDLLWIHINNLMVQYTTDDNSEQKASLHEKLHWTQEYVQYRYKLAAIQREHVVTSTHASH